MDGIWIVYAFLAAFPALIVFAAVYKYMEVAQASRWPSAPGRIVISTTEVRSVRSGGTGSDDTELRNFAKVVFEYKIANRTYRGERVSIGEDLGNFQVAETLARYPVGKSVTVYYNPSRRQQSVLERDLPEDMFKGIAIIVLVLVGLIFVGIVGFRGLGDLVQSVIPNVVEAPFVAACIGFALVFALFIYGFQRAGARAKGWPVVPGRIESSGVHAYQALSSFEDLERWREYFRADVVYGYDVDGVHYTGDKVPVAGVVSASTNAVARRSAARYPVGSVVEVHYNPANPSESVLEPRVPGVRLLWLVPAALLVLAFVVGR